MTLAVEVIHAVNGTTVTDMYTCARASSTMYPRGRTVIRFTDGRDEFGEVRIAQYERAYRVIIRPVTDGVGP